MGWTRPPKREAKRTAVGLRWDFGLSAHRPIFAGVNTYAQPTKLTVDFHEPYEFGVVLEGEMERTWGELSRRMGPGQAWMTAMWEPHGKRCTRPVARVVVVVFLPQDLLDPGEAQAVPWLEMLREAPGCRPKGTSRATRQALLAEGRQLEQEVAEQKPGWSHAVRAHLLRCFWHLREGWSPTRAEGVGGTNALTRLLPALALASRERGDVRLGHAADVCGLSRTRFSALFTQAMGASFGSFCQQTRLGHAARLLVTSDLSLDSIAEYLNFSSGSHLHRAFTRHFRKTPGEFRKSSL